MVIYTVTSRGLCCPDALSTLHFAKLPDTSVDEIPPICTGRTVSASSRLCNRVTTKPTSDQTLSQRGCKKMFGKELARPMNWEKCHFCRVTSPREKRQNSSISGKWCCNKHSWLQQVVRGYTAHLMKEADLYGALCFLCDPTLCCKGSFRGL